MKQGLAPQIGGINGMKIITICGSIKYQREMIKISEVMELRGNCVLPIIYPARESKDDYTKEEFAMFDKMHKEKIKLSDAILVVNKDNYIGTSTKQEIDFAKSLNKEIIYYTDLLEQGIIQQ